MLGTGSNSLKWN